MLPTGAGKSLCFQLPAQFLPHATVVVSPLLALIQDQTTKLDDAGIGATKLDSTLSNDEERRAVSDIVHEDASIVYVTPERLEHPDVIELLRARGVSHLVVDEAHCVSQWGHDFRPSYLSIRGAAKALGRPPIMALTATATPEVAVDVLAQLGMRGAEVVRTDVERKNLFFEVKRTPSEATKREALLELLRGRPGPTIVYLATIRGLEEVAGVLATERIPAVRYHGKMRTAEREAAQDAFMRGDIDVVVATTAFGLGVDKHDVRAVVHYNFPDSLESYYQQAGRAGRDSEFARAVLLYRLEDRRVQAFFLGGKYPRRNELVRTWVALSSSPDRAATVEELAEATGLAERRAKVIVAQLDAMGVASKRGRDGVTLVRAFADAAEFEAFATSYESRLESDREKLDDMMRYAQTTRCRVRYLCEYFGEPHDADCGHCDNCRDHPAETAAPVHVHRPEPALTEAEPLPFAPGDVVRHRSFGRGAVEEVTPEHVRVRFDAGPRTVRADYLSRIA